MRAKVSSRSRLGSYRLCSVGVAVLCVLVAVGQANGQERAPAAKSKPGQKVAPVIRPNATPTVKADALPKPGAGRASNATLQGNASVAKKKPRGKGGVKFEMNPDAKWACDVLSVTREPVWKKSRTLTFEFKIRNEGTADLKIKGKGG